MQEENLRKLLALGLARAEDVAMPLISLEVHLEELLRGDGLEKLLPSGVVRLVAHPTAAAELPAVPPQAEVLLAIGPEAGWEDSELEASAAQSLTCAWNSMKRWRRAVKICENPCVEAQNLARNADLQPFSAGLEVAERGLSEHLALLFNLTE